MRSAAVGCVMLALSSSAWAQEAVPNPTMAVLPLRVEGLQSNEVDRLNDLVRVRAATRFQVQSKETTTDLLEASQSLGVDCDLNAATCGSKLGTIADVSFVLLGSAVGGLDREIGVDLRIVDVKLAIETRRVSG